MCVLAVGRMVPVLDKIRGLSGHRRNKTGSFGGRSDVRPNPGRTSSSGRMAPWTGDRSRPSHCLLLGGLHAAARRSLFADPKACRQAASALTQDAASAACANAQAGTRIKAAGARHARIAAISGLAPNRAIGRSWPIHTCALGFDFEVTCAAPIVVVSVSSTDFTQGLRSAHRSPRACAKDQPNFRL